VKKKKLDTDQFLDGVDRSMTEKEDDYRRLAGNYQVVISDLSEEDGGGYLASVPDLPGCMADGETAEEAADEARDAIEAYLNALNDQEAAGSG
jgi:antitoxin HicB